MPGWWGGCGTGSGGSTPGGPGGSGSGYLASDLIEDARVLVNDDHEETPGWILPERWLRWLNWEMQALARRSVQMGLVRPPISTTTITAPSGAITGAMRIVNVVDANGCELEAAQEHSLPEPFFAPHRPACSRRWAAHGAGDNWTVELDGSDTNTYTVRYIPQPAYVTALTEYVLVPQGFEKRLVYGIASHALIKESSSSSALERKIAAADAEIGLALFGTGASPVVRNTSTPKLPYWVRGRYR